MPIIIVGLLFLGIGIENASQSELIPDAGLNISNATTNITAGETQVLVHSNSEVQGEDHVTVSDKIVVRDTRKMQVKSNIIAINLKKEISTGMLATADFPDGGELVVDALENKNVSVRLKIKGVDKGEFVLDDFGKNNPESVLLPGRVVKYVEIGARGILFSSAEITIRYTGADLNGGSENDLTIYHWNGTSWDALPTTVDATNNVLTATTTSLSSFGVATRLINYLENNEAGANITNTTTTYLSQDELKTKGVAVKLKLNKRGNGQIIIEDHGKKNPVASAPPGNSIKFVDISATDNSFESAEVRIKYTDEELGGADENTLVIYHWNGAAWDALPTMVDAGNNVLTATTNSLSPFAVSGGDAGDTTLIVSVNRFVVLDDPLTTGKTAQTGFALPAFTGWSTNQWSGNQTQIKGYALLLDKNGSSISNTNVTFNISNWNASFTNISNVSTNSNGIAIYTFDMNARNYYGNWTVKATALGKTDSTGFIYNWWGCQAGGCEDHGIRSVGTATPSIQNSPYTLGRETITADTNHNSITDNDCVGCHRGYGGVGGGSTFTGQSTKTADVHITNTCATCHATIATHDTNEPIKSCSDCHSWANLTKEYTMSSGTTPMSNYSGMVAATGHDPNNTIPCIICHGPMHNITKPDESLRPNNNNITEDSHCTTCHTSYNKHNSSNITSGGVNCTLCHSQDIHYIQVFAQNSTGATYVNTTSNSRGNCTLCHQNGTFFASLKNASKAGNYIGRPPPQVQTPVRHSNNASNGSRWNSTENYWNRSSQVTLCRYCHGETNHKSVALGRPSTWDGNNVVNSTIGNTTWCTGCHWQGYSNGSSRYLDMINNVTDDHRNISSSAGYNLSIPPEITGNNTYGASTSNYEYTNHSLYTPFSSNLNDSACNRCHGYQYGFTRITQLMHNQSSVGGPDCVGCHDIGGIVLLSKIDVTATNDTNAIHKNLNSNATATVDSNNRRCWACHGNGSAPSPNTHPTNYKTPYNCTDCHVQGAGQNFNYTPNNTLLNVSQHYWNGASIKTTAVSTCYTCHIKSEMMIAANDPDAGTGAVYSGANGGNNSTSHYGKKRTDLHTWNGSQAVNCSYCHQNISTVFNTAMLDQAYNKSIQNHSALASSPSCLNSSCHNSGWIHNSTLTKPSLVLPNSTYCTSSCHGTGGSAFLTNNKSQHNGTVSCTQCHMNSSRSIHPVRYLQNINNTWNTSNTNAVNCTNCHQNITFWTGSPAAPLIPDPLKHSSNLSNGSIWNSTSTPFWTTEDGSCYYCHGNTKHNSTAFGRINSLTTDPSDVRNGSLVTTRWCVDCHYNDTANSYYNGNQWTPTPPLITVNNTNNAMWQNHSSYLGSGYNDTTCESCHALNGSTLHTSRNYSHSLDEGVAGGPDCKSCHDTGGSAGGGGKLVNFTAMNDTNALHKTLNSNTSSGIYSAENKKCWACHGNGNNPVSSHPTNYKSPSKCVDCHVNRTNLNYTPNSTLLNVTEHYWNGTDIAPNITTCYNCHNKSEMMLGTALDPDGAGSVYSGSNGGNNSSSHYGRKRTDLSVLNSSINNTYCIYCHNNASTVFPFTDIANKSISNHSANYPGTNPLCSSSACHSTGRIHNSTLTKPSLVLPNSTYCTSSCHGTGGSAFLTNNKSQHNGTVSCTQCHMNSSRSIHPVRYLQNINNTWNTSNTNAVNCTNCHQNITFWTGSPPAPLIPSVLKHSSNSNNGSIWNASTTPYWTSNNASCYYCHGNTKHNTTALGSINSLLTDLNNTRNGTLSNTKWCSDCHLNTSLNSNYSGTIWTPVPPLITIDNTGKSTWVNHSSYFGSGIKDSTCSACHAQPGNYASTSLNYSHSLDPGTSGPDCISCHDTGKLARKRINNSAMNSSTSVHRTLNSNASNSTWVSAENKKCWGCHDSTGTQPSNDSMGSRYTNPYTCYDCHNSTSKPYSNVSTAPNVSEHFKGGDQIRAAASAADNSSSCLVCHNLSELKVSYTEDDLSSNSSSLSSHYARNRTDLRTWNANQAVNCSYCHQNSTTLFASAMSDSSYNSSILNHSTGTGSPSCFNSTCHGSGWIHNSTLTRPSFSLPNSTYCTSCHTGKQRHNGSTGMNCTSCHINSSGRDTIHPIKYLQANSSFQTTNTSAVNCTNCHQTSSFWTGSPPAPLIPSVLKHSSNSSNGSIWNSSTTPYWTSSNASCYYCHGNTKHNTTALGSINSLLTDLNNTRNGTLSNTKWC
ncbi:MAG: hypothetical protein PHH85_01775, partial [Candidatus Methanoperedens sp.]|nr:hypothetical protein [Candidatus Methanoperedens sp.]